MQNVNKQVTKTLDIATSLKNLPGWKFLAQDKRTWLGRKGGMVALDTASLT
jgi:hypothetical protein